MRTVGNGGSCKISPDTSSCELVVRVVEAVVCVEVSSMGGLSVGECPTGSGPFPWISALSTCEAIVAWGLYVGMSGLYTIGVIRELIVVGSSSLTVKKGNTGAGQEFRSGPYKEFGR